MLTALTPGTPHITEVVSHSSWIGTGPPDVPDRERCLGGSDLTPTATADLAMRMYYDLGDFNGGQSKTVKFEYGRM